MKIDDYSVKKLVLLFFVVLFFSAVFIFLKTMGLFSTISGVQVLSVSAPPISSNDVDFSKFNYIILTNLYGSDNIVFDLSPNDFKNYYDKNYNIIPERSLNINVKNIDEKEYYSIDDASMLPVSVYYISPIQYSYNPVCQGLTGYNTKYKIVLDRVYPLKDAYFCVFEKHAGFISNLNFDSLKFTANVDISNGFKSYSTILSSDNKGFVVYDEHNKPVVSALWTGSKISGNQPSHLEQDYVAVLTTLKGYKWLLTSKTFTTDYITKNNLVLDTYNTINTHGVGSVSDLENYRDTFKSRISVLNKLVFDYENCYTTIGNDGYAGYVNVYGGCDGVNLRDVNILNRTIVNPDKVKIVKDVPNTISIPEVRWLVRADFLGVVFNVGKPKIVSYELKGFKESPNGYVDVYFKNVGSATATFSGSVTCSNDVYMTRVPDNVVVKPNYIGVLRFYLSGGLNNKKFNSNCNVEIYDTTNTNNKDVYSFNVDFTPIQLCDEGSFTIDYSTNKVYQCVDGVYSKYVGTCASDEVPVIKDNSYTCEKQNNSSLSDFGSNITGGVVNNALNSFFKFVFYILVFAGLILAIYLFFKIKILFNNSFLAIFLSFIFWILWVLLFKYLLGGLI